MKPLVVLALPGMYLVYKINEFKRHQQEVNRRKVTERELANLNSKIVSSVYGFVNRISSRSAGVDLIMFVVTILIAAIEMQSLRASLSYLNNRRGPRSPAMHSMTSADESAFGSLDPVKKATDGFREKKSTRQEGDFRFYLRPIAGDRCVSAPNVPPSSRSINMHWHA